MGLFDVKHGVDNQNMRKKEDPYEEECRSLKTKRSSLIMKLGEKYFELNQNKDQSTTPYAEEIANIQKVNGDIMLAEKKSLASQGYRKCDNCGEKLPISSCFCNKCGEKQSELETEVVRASHVCPKCGTKLEDSDIFCVGCGNKL